MQFQRNQLTRRLIAAMGLMTFAAPLSALEGQPNVVIFFADDLGWSDVSGGSTNYDNGSTFYRTPNINALASQGMAFTSAYAQQNCSPTRSALFTGQYAPTNTNHNVSGLNRGSNDTLLVGPSDGEAILNSAVTLAETLQLGGYTTAHFGKFHSTNSASDIINQHGFDYNYGGTDSGSPGNPSPYFAYQSGGNWIFGAEHGPELDAYADPYTQAYIDANLAPYATFNNPNTLVGTEKHLNDAMADAAIDFLSNEVVEGQPFFMNVAFNAVHTAINSRPDLQASYNGATSTDPRHDGAGYAGLLEGMDQAIGRVVDYLDSHGLGENTLILFYSDNGGNEPTTENSPLRGEKGSLWEGGIRVPLVARMTGTIGAGGISDESVHAVDFYSTIAEFAGVSLPNAGVHPINGESFAGILKGQKSALNRDALYWHFPGYLDTRGVPASVTTRDVNGEHYKLHYFYETDTYELYNLTTDLSEANNLLAGSATDEQFQIATQMAQDLRAWLDSQNAQYLTVRATGAAVHAPSGRTSAQFAFNLGNPSFNGQATGSVTQRGVTVSLEAVGSSAVFDGISTGVGVNSSEDSGTATTQRRVDGSLATPEAIRFSFDSDVVLESLILDSFSTNGSETLKLTFISGDNPFAGITGYNADGFSLAGNVLSFVTSSGAGSPFQVDFGILNRDDLVITADTVLELTANPATSGGFLLNQMIVKKWLSLKPGDLNLDGEVDQEDLDMLLAQTGGFALPGSRVDGDTTGDGLINEEDFDALIANWTSEEAPVIPEPSSLGLLGLSGLLLMRRRRN